MRFNWAELVPNLEYNQNSQNDFIHQMCNVESNKKCKNWKENLQY